MNTSKLTLTLICLLFLSIVLAGCGGVRELRLNEVQKISGGHQFEDDVSINISTTEVFNHTLGIYDYKMYLKDAVEKQYTASLQEMFKGGVKEGRAKTNITVTTLDNSIFPIATLITQVHIFFKVEIFDENMNRQKTVMINGFGSDPDGSRALEKSVRNSFYQLIPSLEELFVK